MKAPLSKLSSPHPWCTQPVCFTRRTGLQREETLAAGSYVAIKMGASQKPFKACAIVSKAAMKNQS